MIRHDAQMTTRLPRRSEKPASIKNTGNNALHVGAALPITPENPTIAESIAITSEAAALVIRSLSPFWVPTAAAGVPV